LLPYNFGEREDLLHLDVQIYEELGITKSPIHDFDLDYDELLSKMPWEDTAKVYPKLYKKYPSLFS